METETDILLPVPLPPVRSIRRWSLLPECARQEAEPLRFCRPARINPFKDVRGVINGSIQTVALRPADISMC
jgi:hypothetical protein